MTYAQFIAKLRAKVGDVKRRQHVDWTADGTSTVFQMPTGSFPVLDDSTHVVKVNGVTKAESTDYTLDKLTGTLILLVAPTSNYPVTIDCFSVHLRDEEWLTIINETVSSLGNDFFKEAIDEATFTTTANMLSLDISATYPNAIELCDIWYRENASEEWTPVDEFANYRFDPETKKVRFGSTEDFPLAGKALKLRLLNGYALGTTVASTLDVQTKFEPVLIPGCEERYWQYRYQDVVELVTKTTQEGTRTRLQELIMLSDRCRRLYEAEKAKLKPSKPARRIPTYINGAGRP